MDLIFIALNHKFWNEFNQDDKMTDQANKLKYMFIFCISPFIVAKILIRCLVYSNPRL